MTTTDEPTFPELPECLRRPPMTDEARKRLARITAYHTQRNALPDAPARVREVVA
jgi:hypothetical protein